MLYKENSRQMELDRVSRGPDNPLYAVEKKLNEIQASDIWASVSHGTDNITFNVMMDKRLDLDVATEEARQAGVGIFYHPGFQWLSSGLKHRVVSSSQMSREQKERRARPEAGWRRRRGVS